ncbi:putative protein FAR1-RELATED SEQUENCE 10 isoform X1 [Triticum dicoccoides]|uniref:putative protein FAR1-RELATED SEQUENCE 10 isoform X1 n=1 Tax=Triticum dicoccoides TaxID=85692 RepID=UPI001891A987|nr:putative protein FAR1-RELATED SEQUENCE 10 isoform X1 [Triticum dicoccoides]
MDLFVPQEGDSEKRISHGQMEGADVARPIESQASISVAEGDISRAGDLCSGGGNAGSVGEGPLLQVCSEATSGWTRRVRIRKAHAERELNPNRKSALELSMRAFISKRDGNVVNPAVGTSFDSLDEAYQFYNLYSWEAGFGIRYSKSRLNVERMKCMQEIVCGCAGKPERKNTRSTRCGCAARIKLLRSDDNGWYISEHRPLHNHSLSSTCGEKMHWPSHRLIDRYTKDLVRQLRENNVSLGKVFASLVRGWVGGGLLEKMRQ